MRQHERQVKSERNKVQRGMTVDEFLPLVHGACGIRTHAVLPDNVSDEEGVHYASLLEHGDGTFGWSSGPDYQSRQLTEEEAAGLMRQKMSDGRLLPGGAIQFPGGSHLPLWTSAFSRRTVMACYRHSSGI